MPHCLVWGKTPDEAYQGGGYRAVEHREPFQIECDLREERLSDEHTHEIPTIERHVLGLSHQLAQGFLDLGLPVCGGAAGPHLAHIVAVGALGSSHDGTEDERFNQLYTFLNDHDVRLSTRRGVLRFSLHVYNTSRDVERVLELTQQWLRGEMVVSKPPETV